MEENYFTFRGEYFKQLKGALIGNLPSPIVTERLIWVISALS